MKNKWIIIVVIVLLILSFFGGSLWMKKQLIPTEPVEIPDTSVRDTILDDINTKIDSINIDLRNTLSNIKNKQNELEKKYNDIINNGYIDDNDSLLQSIIELSSK